MNETTLARLKQGDKATVMALQGDGGFQHRVRSVGLKENKLLRVVARHHLSGPLVVEIGQRQISIGRGMARKIIVGRVS